MKTLFSERPTVIVGGGQIGTSKVLAHLRVNPRAKLVVLDNDPNVQKPFAQKLTEEGFGDRASIFTTNPAQAANAEHVVLSIPSNQFQAAMTALAPHLSHDTIMSDTASAKESPLKTLLAVAEQVGFPQENIVGAHPFNGNAGSGPRTSSIDMFKGKPVFITPTSKSSSEAVQKTILMWSQLDSLIRETTPIAHDKKVGTLSHAEHVIMFAYMISPFMEKALRTGFPDPGNHVQAPTRIGDAGPEMWISTFFDNSNAVLETVGHFRGICCDLLGVLGRDDLLLPDIKRAHAYAKTFEVRDSSTQGSYISPRVKPFGADAYAPLTDLSVWSGFLSTAIAINAERLSRELNDDFSADANPSFRDGIGPCGTEDPQKLLILLTRNTQTTRGMARQFFDTMDALTKDIREGNSGALKKKIEICAQRRRAMPQAIKSSLAA